MKFWDRSKDKIKQKYEAQLEEKEAKKRERNAEAAKAVSDHKRFTSFIDEAIAEHKREGGFEHLEGKGKPLSWEYLQSDVMDNILKKNEFVPDWILLKQEIWNEIKNLKLTVDSGQAVNLLDEINRINKKIVKFNNNVPALSLQRGILYEDNIDIQYERWQ